MSRLVRERFLTARVPTDPVRICFELIFLAA